MTNLSNTVINTGVTNDLHRRALEHKTGKGGVFTKKYKVTKLVWYQSGDNIHSAIYREKQIKAGSGQDKVDLINGVNPDWKDLFEEYFP